MKLTDGPSADSLNKKCKIIFAEYGLPRKMSNAGTNYVPGILQVPEPSASEIIII